jgi:hypothetical protein
MRARLAALSLSTLLGAAACPAQTTQGSPTQVGYATVYCSGFATDQKVPDATRLVSAEQSTYKITFARGDYVHINRGLDKGVRVGDRFIVVRPDVDPMRVQWFRWQDKLSKAMGTLYIDTGQIRVVNVLAKTSVAQVSFSCDYMQRGDIVIPYEDRPAPAFKDPGPFDHFAPVSGKPTAMVVQTRDYQQSSGAGTTFYVNLGTNQGVKVGDYFRIFRYQGSLVETVSQTPGYQDRIYGFGSSPTRYNWNDLPREILGEGIVLNVSRNSSTVFVTFSSAEVYPGDYVEIE